MFKWNLQKPKTYCKAVSSYVNCLSCGGGVWYNRTSCCLPTHKAAKQNSSPSHWIQRQLITAITREMLQTWALEEKRRFHHLGSKFLFSYLEVPFLTIAGGLFHKDKCTMNTRDSEDIVFDWLVGLIDESSAQLSVALALPFHSTWVGQASSSGAGALLLGSCTFDVTAHEVLWSSLCKVTWCW